MRCAHTWHQDATRPHPEIPIVTEEETATPELPSDGEALPPTELPPLAAGPAPMSVTASESLHGLPDFAHPGPTLPAKQRALPRVRRNVVTVGWAALAAGVLVLVLALAALRQPLVAGWPATSRLYAMVGAAPAAPVEIADVAAVSGSDSGKPALILTGKLMNRGMAEHTVEPLTVEIRNAGNRVIRHLTVTPTETRLAAGASTGFRVAIPGLPDGGGTATIGFAAS